MSSNDELRAAADRWRSTAVAGVAPCALFMSHSPRDARRRERHVRGSGPSLACPSLASESSSLCAPWSGYPGQCGCFDGGRGRCNVSPYRLVFVSDRARATSAYQRFSLPLYGIRDWRFDSIFFGTADSADFEEFCIHVVPLLEVSRDLHRQFCGLTTRSVLMAPGKSDGQEECPPQVATVRLAATTTSRRFDRSPRRRTRWRRSLLRLVYPSASTSIEQCMFHVFHFGTAATGVVWLYYFTTVYAQQYLGTTRGRRYRVTHTLPASETDGCFSSTVNVDADAGDGYCIGNVPFTSWVMYAMMIFSEFLSFVVGLLFNFSMWRSICRGARYMDDFELPTPREQWPMVDILLCHYVEPVTGSMQTLKNYLSPQYAPELLDMSVLDVGYYNGPEQDDESLKTWLRQHSSVRELRKEGGKGAQRRDCSVGSLSDYFDFRERGILSVTFIGRMMPDTPHSRLENITNCLFNEGADGTYVLILDNDMKPYPKLFLAVLSFFFSEGEAVDGGGLQCSDDISWTHVLYGQASADSSVI
ncbi:unnamed protein product [Hyaloperonospora brassicae]|uniref:Glycosyltransferase 2-like domain-containing protein n=1 Tax=Hyaloperonospora brassicae TaxID=162125 RepID=A0AAV0UYY2_HYABA|nr:unnamed protein product [Hyaloperonospora brassicae]